MSDPSSVGLDELLRIAHELPSKVSRLHLKTTSEFVAGKSHQRVVSWAGETWLEYEPASWVDDSGDSNSHILSPSPIRFRDEGSEGWVHGQNAEILWQELAFGLFVQHRVGEDGRSSHRRYSQADWVPSTFWSWITATLELGPVEEVIGRRAATILLTNVDRKDLPIIGDEHRFAIDLETGLLLRHECYVEGALISEREVTELSLPDAFPDGLFAPPAGKVPVRESTRLYTSAAAMVSDWPFPLLLPRSLPEGYAFSDGSIRYFDDQAHWALLHYLTQHDYEEIDLTERPVWAGAEELPGWEPFKRGERVVHVSNTTPDVGRRHAHLTIGEIYVDISATQLSVEELVEFAFSLE